MSKTAMVREADQLIGEFSVETAPNDFIRRLVAEAVQSGEAAATDQEGVEVTAVARETVINDHDWIKEGARVEAGEGEDHDTGRVVSVDGDMAIVAWDSGVKTPCPVEDLWEIDE